MELAVQVIEEAPAPNISLEFRQSIGQAAVAAGLAVGYQGAGTVEFIVDMDTGDYFFMEMNTRLQAGDFVTDRNLQVCRKRFCIPVPGCR